MPTTEKWPLTSDRELDALLVHLRRLDDWVFSKYMVEIITQLRARLAAAESDRDRYRAALEFYADEDNWYDPDVIDPIPGDADYDRGDRARAALEGEPDAESH